MNLHMVLSNERILGFISPFSKVHDTELLRAFNLGHDALCYTFIACLKQVLVIFF